MIKNRIAPVTKFNIRVLITSSVLLFTLVFFSGAAQVRHPGDVSGDGEISAEDARLCLRQAVGLESFAESGAEYRACDVDGENGVTAADARLILRAAVGLEELPAHVFGAWTPETDGDGVPTGKHTRTCAACGIVETEVCAYGEKVYVTENNTPACTAGCTYTETCAVCGGVKTTREEATGHSFGSWTPETDGDGVLTGKHTRICAACGEVATEVCAYGEKVYVTENNAPTCTAGCTYTETCPVCGGVKTTKEAALKHRFGAWTPEAELENRHVCTCVVCGKLMRETCTLGEKVYVSANQKPTCTEACVYTRTCVVCGRVNITEVAATGHSFGAWTPETDGDGAPTGKHIRTCAVCSETETENCAFGEKIYVTENKAPTCTADCTYTETCTVCGGVKTTTEKALGHRLAPAGEQQVCERCGKTFLFTASNEYDILRSDVFYCSGTITDGNQTNPLEMSFFANGFYTRTSLDGMHIAIQMLGSDVYLIAPDKNAYYKSNRTALKLLGLDIVDLTDSVNFRNLPALSEADIETEGILDGESCTVYTFLQADGKTLVYMQGDKLLGMDAYDANWVRTSCMRFTAVSKTIPAHVTAPGGGTGRRVLSLVLFLDLFD